MGRQLTAPNLRSEDRPFTGSFGFGEQRFFATSGTFTIPANVTSVRVRVWGGGASGNGAGGTSSFGSHVSATGGSASYSFGPGGAGGSGSNGDIN